MERRLDREKYPEYVYPEHKPDHSKPERESIVKLGKMITSSSNMPSTFQHYRS